MVSNSALIRSQQYSKNQNEIIQLILTFMHAWDLLHSVYMCKCTKYFVYQYLFLSMKFLTLIPKVTHERCRFFDNLEDKEDPFCINSPKILFWTNSSPFLFSEEPNSKAYTRWTYYHLSISLYYIFTQIQYKIFLFPYLGYGKGSWSRETRVE